jgi:hypothetical protein
MSELLGPYGQATIVLMRAHFDGDLPKLKDLKKLLNITDGKYFKSGGRNYSKISTLQDLLVTLKDIRGEGKAWREVQSSDYLVTAAQVHSNLFMSLKYTAQVLDGFNLTTQCFEDLEALLTHYRLICSMRSDITSMWTTLERNAERAINKEIVDETILKPDLVALQKILHGYGDLEYAKAVKDLQDWYETYRWKVKSNSSTPSASDEDEPEEADAI